MTRLFVGGPLGKGDQWFSWINIEDLIEKIVDVLEKPELVGPVNLTSPNPIRQNEFAHALGRALGRPSCTPAPSFALRILLGEFADVLLFSQRMVPDKLLKLGSTFRFPDVDSALKDLFGEKG